MLRFVGYDPKRRILEVVFNSGDRYQYKGVPSKKYEEMMKAESLGQYMHKNILRRYPYERIR